MWRNGRRKGLKIPRGGPVPVRVRSQAPALQARLEAIRKREFGTSATPFFSARPTPSLSAPFMSPENEIVGTRRRKQCRSLQVAIGCFREKVYYTLSESRALFSPIGNRYAGRSRDLSHLRQVVPYRRSLFRRSAMNCLSPYASLFTSCVNCIRSLRLPLAATFAKLLQALSRRRQFCSEAPGASTTDGSLALLAKIYEAASLPHIFSLFWLAFH